jgi:enterochelin esterase-like enzyme
MKKTVFTGYFWLFAFSCLAQMPNVACGTLHRWENFASTYVDARNVDIWLPPGYDGARKLPVLYMHDGQMLFDSNITWNRQAWEVEDVLCDLMEKKMIQTCMVVGIWNNGAKRAAEYFPQKAIAKLDENGKKRLLSRSKDEPSADAYLNFIVKELKPKVDATFATLSDPKNTFIAGSSMGGLISLYAICEYPEVFGGAACLSTHWPGIFTNENNPIPDAILSYTKEHLPSPKNHRIYFDHGTATLDSLYGIWQKKADKIMKKKGFSSKNWKTSVFPDEPHTETAWRRRFHVPIVFLLGKPDQRIN